MPILIQILSNPSLLSSLNQSQWQIVLAQASTSQLVARIDYLMDFHQYKKPMYVKWHLESAYKIAEKQRKQALVEFLEVPHALKNASSQLIFLKGAAYIAKNLPCSFGRTFSDIDVLVKKDELAKIEMILKFSNWLKTELDDYDDQYYRTWMHEIPPLYHVTRGSVLDVHHNILPSTNKHMPKVDDFSFSNVEIPNIGTIQTLSDKDLCIHMAVHLFTESEFHHGLRDISDFDMILRHFQQFDNTFVSSLLNRARELGLYEYTRLALRYSHMLFNTPIQNKALSSIQASNFLKTKIQDYCFSHIFQPDHKSCRTWHRNIAEFILYWRGHLLRMPLRLLLPHLIKKSYKRIKEYFQQDQNLGELP